MIHVKKISGLLVFALLSASAVFAEDAIILETEGSVEVQGKSGSSWIPATNGAALFAGDVVRTGEDGSVTILFSDGSRYDMFPGGLLTVTAGSEEKRGLLKRLWGAITGKFADTRYTKAYVGGVGTLRGKGMENEVIYNDELDAEGREELEQGLAEIDGMDLPPEVRGLLSAVLLDQYGQYEQAEARYLAYLALNPEDDFAHDLLLELYIKLDFYSHARELLEEQN